MSWSLKEAVKNDATNPQKREEIKEYIATLVDTNPEKAAYWQAILDNDVNAVDKKLTRQNIARVRERLKTAPPEMIKNRTEYLEFLENRLAKLEANS